jgi:hypothetical protein
MTMILYKVTNNINKKIYIGKTTQSLEKRKLGHLYQARSQDNMYFHKAILKYGINNFKWEIIYDKCNCIEDLNELEEFIISEYFILNKNNVYNIAKGGNGPPSRKGSKLTEDHKKKIGESNKGKIRTKETLLKLSESHKGYKPTEETKRKFKENIKNNPNFGMRGKKQNIESRKKIGEASKGRLHTQEWKDNLSKKTKGKNRPTFSEEWKENLSRSHKGQLMSEETKNKISISLRGRIRSEEHQRKLNESRRNSYLRKKEMEIV